MKPNEQLDMPQTPDDTRLMEVLVPLIDRQWEALQRGDPISTDALAELHPNVRRGLAISV